MKKSLIGMLAVLMTGTGAFAADLYQPAEPAPYVDAPEIEVREASGWYLRGDVGYSFNKLRGAEFFQGGTALGLTDFRTSKLDDAFMGGVGVGYQINNYLRTDLTFDYMGKADFRGSTVGTCGVSSIACTSTDIASLKAYSLMANAYVDFGTYGRVTPYAGAGIGGSYVKWGNLKNTSCADDGSGCDPTTEHGGKGSWRFAYALMAGASIDVTCNVKADVGYRFRHITKGDMFGFANGSGPGKDKGLYSHEVRVGGRYVFGGCETAQYMEPAPIPVEPAVYK